MEETKKQVVNQKRKNFDDSLDSDEDMFKEADDPNNNSVNHSSKRAKIDNEDVAVEEAVALVHPKLCIFTEKDIATGDELPQHKFTCFSIYDEDGNLCAIDGGLLEQNVQLYLRGYLKPIFEDDPSAQGGIAVRDAGPINEWWVSGFDGGATALFGLNTAFADYVMMAPSEEYKPFMHELYEKIYLSKFVIELLLGQIEPTYEDLLSNLKNVKILGYSHQVTEETLLKHAQFIYDQVAKLDTYDDTADELLHNPCMETLLHLTGIIVPEEHDVKLSSRKKTVRKVAKGRRVVEKTCTKATTTPLVADMFNEFFHDQLAIPSGPQQSSNAVANNKGPKTPSSRPSRAVVKQEKVSSSSVTWIGETIGTLHGCKYYKQASIDDQVIAVGDYLAIIYEASVIVGQVEYMWEDNNKGRKQQMLHCRLFARASETIIGETGDEREVFATDTCFDAPFQSVHSKAIVDVLDLKASETSIDTKKYSDAARDGDNHFYCQKRYVKETARFEDLLPDLVPSRPEISHYFCTVCARRDKQTNWSVPIAIQRRAENGTVTGTIVKFKGEVYKAGSCVFLAPETFPFKYNYKSFETKAAEQPKVDESIHTEFYRKNNKTKYSNSNKDTPNPYDVGHILSIEYKPSDPSTLRIKVVKLYRPENTHVGQSLINKANLNLLYWSNEEVTVSFDSVIGKCYLMYGDKIGMTPEDWFLAGPNRFYFLEGYNSKAKEFEALSENAMDIDRFEAAPAHNEVPKKLNTMDIFAGCGGLSEGLHQAGIAVSKWAIEINEEASKAYKLNNPETEVYNEDCNVLLQRELEDKGGSSKNDNKVKRLPQKGQVEFLCGGPPCQGFSGMNRFNSREYSLFRNSLVAVFLSYCDHYRPKFILMENVRNFVFFKKGMVLKLTLRCLLKMGYQCTFGILQAGCYGVPQTRRRMIILAAAPGERLPSYPEPLHVFSKRASHVSVSVDEKKFEKFCVGTNSAPYRTITVRDAMAGDLPSIKYNSKEHEISYISPAISHFQRMVRRHSTILRDHVCKDISACVAARIERIPSIPGADWRDLPNVQVKINDKVVAKKLIYSHNDSKDEKKPRGQWRGVCSCIEGGDCDPQDRQEDTLIPWCLPHTASRNNQWTGLYGRLEWDGFFGTTVTNPEPMGMQGRVLHPVDNRLVSVRECARSQGFPDNFLFSGTTIERHCQVGNAVPPPLAAALGYEIRKCIATAADTTSK